MKDRIKAIIKDKHITNQELADALHISKSAVESYQYRNIAVPDRTIADICRLYGINEIWLRTGEGEMYAPLSRDDEIGLIISELLTIDDESIKSEYYKMIHDADEELLKQLFDNAKIFVDALQKNHPAK